MIVVPGNPNQRYNAFLESTVKLDSKWPTFFQAFHGTEVVDHLYVAWCSHGSKQRFVVEVFER